jgi:predicted ATPase
MNPPLFTANDFRVLHQLEWAPQGVCLLVGANGTGKTTTLQVLGFLRALFERGHEAALNFVGGAYLKRLKSNDDEPVLLQVEVADICWKLQFPLSERGSKGHYGEELYHQGKLILKAELFKDTWQLGKDTKDHDPSRCCAKVLWDRGEAGWMKPLVDVLIGIRIYSSYWLNAVQRPEALSQQDSFLHGTGKNLWSVLSNWKASPLRYNGQFDWVLQQAKAAMPDLIGQIEFDRGLTFLYPPNATDPADGLPPAQMPDGLLTALLHLTAVAGAPRGSIVAFDEMENQLHPYAIRSLLRSMQERAEEKNLTIVLTTHSPVLMSAFRTQPDQIFVLERGHTPLPIPLTSLHEEDWLAAFALGDLYDRLEFAVPLGVKK